MTLDRSAPIPLFPLPELVMFPGVRLPMHIFEPRYRVMLRDALRSPDPSFVLVRSFPEDGDDDTAPRIATVGCIGRIAEHAPVAGGRSNILVVGIERVRIAEIETDTPYRMTRWEPIEDVDDPPSADEDRALRHVVSAFCRDVRAIEADFDLELPLDLDASKLADLAAFHLVADSDARQRILECTRPAERVRLTTDAILGQAAMLRPDRGALN